MSLLDIFTGGENKDAQKALERARQEYANVHVPTRAELELPELERYVQAGLMTPAQAQAVSQGPNAYQNITVDPASMAAEIKALNQLQDVASSGGLDAQSKAKLAEALDATRTQEQGAQGAIREAFAQRGIPTSLMEAALMSANAGQQSESANKAATQAAGDASQRALEAMSTSGTMAGNIHGQQYGEEANKAQAQNAINQWNAANQTNVNLANTANKQASNLYNTENAQNIANQNTGLGNTRTMYNAQVPETIFSNQMSKTAGMAGADTASAAAHQAAGQQTAGLYSGLIGAAANALAPGVSTSTAAPPPGYNQNYNYSMLPAAHGAVVPGKASVPGDSESNDKVHALLSPGEIVIPRSIAPNPEAVKTFVAHIMKSRNQAKSIHPEDLKTIMDAMTARRMAHGGIC